MINLKIKHYKTRTSKLDNKLQITTAESRYKNTNLYIYI